MELVMSCPPAHLTEKATKKESTTLEQGTRNGEEPILCPETIVVGATPVRPQEAPNDPKTRWRQKGRKERKQHHHNSTYNLRNGNYI